MIETQEDLRAAQEKIKQLEKGSCPEDVSHLEELQHQNRQLSEELDNVRAERDGLLSSASCTMSTVTGLTEERDQLKEILEGLRQEKIQDVTQESRWLSTVRTETLSECLWRRLILTCCALIRSMHSRCAATPSSESTSSLTQARCDCLNQSPSISHIT